MTEEQAWKYRNSGFSKCPYCESSNIEADRFDHDTEAMPVECGDCGEHWQDNYSITSVGFYKFGSYNSYGLLLEDRV